MSDSGLKAKAKVCGSQGEILCIFFSYFVTRYFVVRWKLCKCAVKNPVLYSYRQYSNESGQENNVIAGSSLGLHAVWKTDFNLFHSFNLVYSLFILACWTLGPNKGPWWYRTWVEWHFRSRQKVVLKQRPEWRYSSSCFRWCCSPGRKMEGPHESIPRGIRQVRP